MNIAFSLGVAALLCWAGLAWIVWRYRPPTPLWPVMFWFTLTGTAWSAGELGASFGSAEPAVHWRWLVLLYTGVLFHAPLWWILSLRFARLYGGGAPWMSRRLVWGAPFALAALCWLGLVTNPWHGAFIEPVLNGRNEYGLLWYLQALSAYACFIASFVIIGRLYRRQPEGSLERSQLAILWVAPAIPLSCNFLYVTRIWSPVFDPTLLAFGVALVIVFVGIVRKRLFAIGTLTIEHLIDHETDGVVLLDLGGKLVRSNPAAARMFSRDTLPLELDFAALLNERLEKPWPDAGSLWSELIDGRRPAEGYVLAMKSGPCRWLRVSATRVPGRWPGRGGIGVRLRDETALQEAIDRETQNAESIQAILGSIHDGIVVFDDAGNLSYANERLWEMLSLAVPTADAGVEARQLLGAVRERLRVPEVLDRALTSGALVEHLDLESKDGRSLRLATVPLLHGGRPSGSIWSFRDTTEEKRADEARRQMEERARESQKLESLGVLAGGIAHDFNNMLVGILGNVELAMARLSSDAKAYAHLVGVKRSSDRATELIQQLLAYAGRGRQSTGTIDLRVMIEETHELVRTAISKKAELTMELEPGVFVEGDAVQLRQILMNLITNASDALDGEAGRITIRSGTRTVDGAFLRDAFPNQDPKARPYAFLEISDTGRGMDASTLARMFEPFYSTKVQGRGLGLSATLGIVRSHEGFIKVRSAPGEGTTLLLLLPSTARSTPAAAERRDSKAAVLGRPSGTVLVIDDEEMVRSVAKGALELEGFDVRLASDGHDGVELFRDHLEEIEAIVLDLTMPRMDGAEALFAIRQISRDVPVILSSGYSREDTMAKCAGLAGVSFIQKPYTPAELVRRVRTLLRSRDPVR